MTKYSNARLAALAETRRPTAAEERMLGVIAGNTAARFSRAAKGAGVEQEDLVSEALIGAWMGFLTHDTARGALRTWIITRCRFAVLNALVRGVAPYLCSSLEAPLPFEHREDAMIRLEDALTTPDETEALIDRLATARIVEVGMRVIEQHDRRTVLRGRGQVNRRDVIRLRVWEQLPCREIGRRLDCSESRVSQLWADALTVMRAAVEALR
jgi:RNA polymerase sigma factor (sigma-70 family)